LRLLSLLVPRLLPMTRLPLLAARWMPMRVWAWGQDGRGVKDGHCYFKFFSYVGGGKGVKK
jgi:hypothetical protein